MFPASRFGGGTYRRPGRYYASSICEECASRLLASVTPGHTKVSRWGIHSLKHALAAAERQRGRTAVETP